MINFNKQNFGLNFKANIMPKNQAKHIDNVLRSGKSVDIFCHTISDEDSFNSATTFYNYLQKEGIKPRIIVSGGETNYRYDTEKYNILQAKDVNEQTQKSDTALCVDFSSPERLNPNVLNHLYKYTANSVVGLDHHDDANIHPSYNYITESYDKNNTPQLEAKNYYIDSSAKSNSSVVYRFFEALGKKLDKDSAKSLLIGLRDDTGKNICALDTNTLEIKNKLTSKLSKEDLKEIDKYFDDKIALNDDEIAFKNSLNERTKYSSNGKFAYLVISEGDKQWEDLGKNTEKTTSILRNYQKDILANNKNIEAVGVFYPCNDNNTYKMSLTSNKNYAKKIVDFAKENYNRNLMAGGHPDRCGGTIYTNNPEVQENWINTFVNAADCISY